MARLLDLRSANKEREISVLFPAEHCIIMDSGIMHFSKETEVHLKNLGIKWDYLTLYDRMVLVAIPKEQELLVSVGFSDVTILK